MLLDRLCCAYSPNGGCALPYVWVCHYSLDIGTLFRRPSHNGLPMKLSWKKKERQISRKERE